MLKPAASKTSKNAIKYRKIQSLSDFFCKSFDVVGNNRTLDTARSNRFDYKENINAAYFNFNKQYKGFMIQVGVRVENSNITGQSLGNKKNGNGYVGGIPQIKVFWERIRNKIPETEQFNKILYLKSVQIEKNIQSQQIYD